jgi:hypothetical protein
MALTAGVRSASERIRLAGRSDGGFPTLSQPTNRRSEERGQSVDDTASVVLT